MVHILCLYFIWFRCCAIALCVHANMHILFLLCLKGGGGGGEGGGWGTGLPSLGGGTDHLHVVIIYYDILYLIPYDVQSYCVTQLRTVL